MIDLKGLKKRGNFTFVNKSSMISFSLVEYVADSKNFSTECIVSVM